MQRLIDEAEASGAGLRTMDEILGEARRQALADANAGADGL